MSMIDTRDETKLVDRYMPKTWTCPRCGNRNRTNLPWANDILTEHMRDIEQCDRCGALHLFTLELTDGFKRRIVEEAKAIAKSIGLDEGDLF